MDASVVVVVDQQATSSLEMNKDSGPAPAAYLDVQNKNNITETGEIPKFEKHNLIGKFQITKEQEYSVEQFDIRKQIPIDEFDKLKGVNLGAGYELAVLIDNYQKYHELKQDCFLKWIMDNDFFSKIEQNVYKRPNFICFGGRISEALQTPLKTRFGEWQIYASKFKDCIFIWDEKKGRRHQHSKESFYGIAFAALLSGLNPAEEAFNELEREFAINEVSFGEHQLLLLNEIEAMNSNERVVEISVSKKCSPLAMKAKYLKSWAQCIVAGGESVIFGHREDEGRVEEIHMLSMDEIRKKVGSLSDVNRCFDFENRLLNWIKSHFKENDPKIVKKFQWLGAPRYKGQKSRVSHADVPANEIPNALFPKWFVSESTEIQVQKVQTDCSYDSGNNILPKKKIEVEKKIESVTVSINLENVVKTDGSGDSEITEKIAEVEKKIESVGVSSNVENVVKTDGSSDNILPKKKIEVEKKIESVTVSINLENVVKTDGSGDNILPKKKIEVEKKIESVTVSSNLENVVKTDGSGDNEITEKIAEVEKKIESVTVSSNLENVVKTDGSGDNEITEKIAEVEKKIESVGVSSNLENVVKTDGSGDNRIPEKIAGVEKKIIEIENVSNNVDNAKVKTDGSGDFCNEN